MADTSINTSVNGSVNSITGASKTDRGTPIVKKNGVLDKNSFLRILVTEMSNQDPTAPKDPTANIAQLAQFSSLEQLTNLNNTLSFSGATSLLGKTIFLNGTDELGKALMGNVKGISKNGDNLNVTVQLIKKGIPEIGTDGLPKFTDFDYKDVIEVADIGNTTSNNPTPVIPTTK